MGSGVLALAGAAPDGDRVWAAVCLGADRRRSSAWLAAASVGAQVLFHVALTGSHAGAVAHGGGSAPSGGTATLLAHAAAAVGTALLLAGGDEALWAVFEVLRTVVRAWRPAAPAVAPSRPPAPPANGHEVVPVGRLLAASCARRGPPRLAAA